MSKVHRRRSLAAIVTSLASLALMATPAAATSHNAYIDSGIAVFTKTGVSESLNFAPGSTSTCPIGSLTLDDGTGTTLRVTAFDRVGLWTTTTGGAATYILHMFRMPTGNTAGSLNTATGTITNMRVALQSEIFTAPTTGCLLPGGAPLCSLGVLLNLSGVYTPTGALSASTAMGLTGSSVGAVVAVTTCTAGPSFLLTTTVAITTSNTLFLGVIN